MEVKDLTACTIVEFIEAMECHADKFGTAFFLLEEIFDGRSVAVAIGYDAEGIADLEISLESTPASFYEVGDE